MDTKKELKLKEIKNRLQLAKTYYKAALLMKKKKEYFRMTIDLAYNATELAAKCFLLLKIDDLPSRHSGIIRKFSQFYIKEEILSKELGRKFHNCFDLRNKARYVPEAKIEEADAKSSLDLAKEMIKNLEKFLKKQGRQKS
jgi:uncharacterized protein (UPF0332 family)